MLRVTLSIALIGAIILVIVPAAAQASTQSFYFAPDEGLSLEPIEDLREALSAGADVCVVVCVGNAQSTAFHEYQLTAPGSVVPVSARLWVEASMDTIVSPVGYEDNCPVTVYFNVWSSDDQWKGGWYYCEFPTGLNPLIATGIYELNLEYRNDLAPIQAQQGDWITISVWAGTFTTGQPPNPTLFLLGGPEYPSAMVLAGTNEPIPGADEEDESEPVVADEEEEPEPSPSPTPTTSPSPSPSPEPTPTPEQSPSETVAPAPIPPDSKTTPAPTPGLLALGLVMLAWIRYRKSPPF